MLRHIISKKPIGLVARNMAAVTIRPLSTTAVRNGEGATGSIRYGGQQQGDAFTKREKAAEDLYIRQREAAIMKALRERIAKQQDILEADQRMLQEIEEKYDQSWVDYKGTH